MLSNSQIRELTKDRTGKYEVLLTELVNHEYGFSVDPTCIRNVGGTVFNNRIVLDCVVKQGVQAPNGRFEWEPEVQHWAIKRSVKDMDSSWMAVLMSKQWVDDFIKMDDEVDVDEKSYIAYLYNDVWVKFDVKDIRQLRAEGNLVVHTYKVSQPETCEKEMQKCYMIPLKCGLIMNYVTTQSQRDEIYRYHKNPVSQSDLDRLNAIPLGEEVKEEPKVVSPYF